ncbi:MAG: RpiB/LacA/LacB family sugar-phosphate isomerase [Armatimonadetes bacterium]|nr:RpiB/LacA/LacB family sugar-phosphate isomerase [Armatimonadota bacterium]
MKLAFASEVCSFDLMQQVKEHLIEMGHEVIDLGMKSKDEPHVFYNTAPRVAKAVVDGTADRGILACGTGMGVCLCANKFKGIYAGVAESATTARLHYVINRANILCLGAWVVGRLQAFDIVDAYLSSEIGAGMSEERRRVQAEGFAKIQGYENENFK